MKRSECLALICNQLRFLNGTFDGVLLAEELSNEQLAQADVILTTLEHAGMLPPEIDKVIEKHDCTVNEWEPEDSYTGGTWKRGGSTAEFIVKLKPAELTSEELADVIANDEDLKDE